MWNVWAWPLSIPFYKEGWRVIQLQMGGSLQTLLKINHTKGYKGWTSDFYTRVYWVQVYLLLLNGSQGLYGLTDHLGEQVWQTQGGIFDTEYISFCQN